jgi:hypothetical protein
VPDYGRSLGLSRPEISADWCRLAPNAERPGRLATNAGLVVELEGGRDLLARAGTIVVPVRRLDGKDCRFMDLLSIPSNDRRGRIADGPLR